MAKVAGGSVLSLREHLARAYGDGAFERVLDAMDADAAAPLRGIVLPVNHYPTESFVRAIEVAADLFDRDGFYERYGAFAAEFEINRFQRIFLRFASPIFLVERAGRIWNRFHDSGTWEVEGSENHLRGTLRDFAIVNEHYCRVLGAWILRACEMTGVRGEVTHAECRARGDAACVFVGSWR